MNQGGQHAEEADDKAAAAATVESDGQPGQAAAGKEMAAFRDGRTLACRVIA
jgi:hypothetical protein